MNELEINWSNWFIFILQATSDAKLPVMVFIHGGGLEIGQGFIYEPDFLLDKDIVLVIIQYRLGPLGKYIYFMTLVCYHFILQ